MPRFPIPPLSTNGKPVHQRAFHESGVGTKYAGTTSTTLTISNLTASDGLPVYLLTAVNGGGSTTSSVALVYVQAAPVPPTPGSYGAFALSLTNNNPVAFWQLNETNNAATGLLQAYNFTGSGLNGTYGTASLNAFNGIMGPTNYPGFAANQGALQTVSGTPASEVIIPPFSLNTNSSVITTNGVTISMWINPTAAQGTFTGLFMYRNNTTEGFGFGGTTSGGMAGLGYTWNNNSGTTYNYSSGLYPVIGIWQYVALVLNSNSATIYLYYVTNGVPVLLSASQSIALNSYTFNGGTTFIGSDANAGAGRTFIGDISDVAVYNSALSPGQIAQQFTTGLAVGGFAPQISGLPSNTFYPAPLASGQSVTISAAVNGTYPTTNHWTFNGTNLANGPSGGHGLRLADVRLDCQQFDGEQRGFISVAGHERFWRGDQQRRASDHLAGHDGGAMAVGVKQPGRHFRLFAGGDTRRHGGERDRLLDQ